MKLFFKYVKTKWKTLLACLFFALVFLFTFMLFRVDKRVIMYPSILCLIFGILFLIFDFLRVKKLCQSLEMISKMRAETIGELPETDALADIEYRKIIENLKNECISNKTEDFKSFCDMVDYYTLWAHQIKTPISAMKLVLQKEDSPISRQLGSDLFKIEQYVEMVLTYLRLDSESSDFTFEKLSLDDVIKASVRKFAHEFIKRNITLKYEETKTNIISDEKWLSFVIDQLLSNALKYTKEGGKIQIGIDENNSLFIQDTGIGIAPSDIPRVFERGYTGYNGRKDKSSSGIGLYLCKRVCEQIAVKIEVSSKLGEGTKITLCFCENKRLFE